MLNEYRLNFQAFKNSDSLIYQTKLYKVYRLFQECYRCEFTRCCASFLSTSHVATSCRPVREPGTAVPCTRVSIEADLDLDEQRWMMDRLYKPIQFNNVHIYIYVCMYIIISK